MDTLSIPEILAQITRQAHDLVDPRGGDRHLSYLAQMEDGILKVTHGYPNDVFVELVSHLGQGTALTIPTGKKGISVQVAITGKSRLVNDVHEDNDYLPCISQTQSQLSVPILIDNAVRGVITVEHSKINAFDKLDQYALEALAAFAAKYLQLSETKVLLGARTALAWKGLESNVLFHEIRSKARTIRGHTEELARAVSRNRVRQERSLLTEIDNLAEGISRAQEVKPLDSELSEPLDVDALIRSRTEQRWSTKPFRAIVLDLALGLGKENRVRSQPEWLRRALDILLDNAAEALDLVEDKRIAIQTVGEARNIVIEVSDSGPGVDADVRDYLFRLPISREGRKGRGMGLLMAQAIVQTYGGDITLVPLAGTGATFRVSLPRESTAGPLESQA